jgi:hypothetical protein
MSLTKSLHGREIRVLPQPPEFVSRPWFSLTVRIDGPGLVVGINSLSAALRTQLGWAADVPLAFRLQHVKVYGPLVPQASATPLQQINVAILDPIAENLVSSGAPFPTVRVIEQFTRYPDQVNRACIGFAYGLTHSLITLESGPSTSDVELLRSTGLGTGSLILYHVLFRTGSLNPANLPTNSSAPKPWFGS